MILFIIFYNFNIYNYLPNFNISLDLKSVIFYILTGLSIPSIFILTKSSKIDNRIGDLSYPIYIVHMLIIYIASQINKQFDLNINKGILVIT